MNESSSTSDFQHRNTLVIILSVASFVFSEALIYYYPTVYWYDGHIRLALRDQILLGRWLPLLQTLIFIISKFSRDLLILRGCLAILAAGTLASMYYLANRIFAPTTGLIAAALLGVSPIFVALSIVPYTEILFAGLLFLALNLLEHPVSSRHFGLGVLALNLASLTRYEGWLLAGMLILEAAIRCLKSKEWTGLIKKVFLYSMVPLGWFAVVLLSPGGVEDELKGIIGSVVMSTSSSSGNTLPTLLSLDYIRSFAVEYFHLLEWQTGPVMIALGILGWLMALLNPGRRAIHWRILTFVVLVWILWLSWFSVNLWQPFNFAVRTAFITQIFLILYAAHGLEQLTRAAVRWLATLTQKSVVLRWQGGILLGATLVLGYFSVFSAIKFVSQTSQAADFYVPAQIGAWLNRRLSQDDAIWVLCDDAYRAYAVDAYVARPFDTVMDHRFDMQFIQSRLRSMKQVYIIKLYKSRLGLSADENTLLSQLEDGHIPAQRFSVAETDVWVVQSGEISNFTSSH